MQTVQLKELAYVRSGDKGDICNIGLLALNAENYELIRREVTPGRDKAFFGEMVKGPVKIYEMPNIHALEIVLHNALDGGATRTLRFDQTGKAMGTALLRLEVVVE